MPDFSYSERRGLTGDGEAVDLRAQRIVDGGVAPQSDRDNGS
jgi:hypothetical protein